MNVIYVTCTACVSENILGDITDITVTDIGPVMGMDNVGLT